MTWGASLAVLAFLALGCAPEQPPRNLLFISLDTTRTDHLSLYGYERRTTPWAEAFFADGAVVENAVAQFNMTVPSHTSMFTSVYPHTHGNRRRTGFPERFVTLAEILRREGLRTAAAVSGYMLRGKSCSLDRGFEVYSSRFPGMRGDGGLTIDNALVWLRTLRADERFFLFVHLYDAHGPYRENHHLDSFRSETPGPELDFIPPYQRIRHENGELLTNVNAYVDRYDAQIRYQDELLERLLAEVDEKQTLVWMTGDHGETFVGRANGWNFDHGHNLYLEQTRIPLALRGPGVPAGRFANIVETVDFLPTILELMEIEADRSLWEGESFASVLTGAGPSLRDELAFSSSDSVPPTWEPVGYSLDGSRQLHALESRRWKLIRYPGVDEDYFELFDLESDPDELESVAESYPEITERMSAVLASWLEGATRPDAKPSDLEDDLKFLRALGYVD